MGVSVIDKPRSAGTIWFWERHHMNSYGKVAVITGGKLGRVVARQLAERGMNLVLSYRGSKEETEQTVALVRRIPLSRLGKPNDVAGLAVCLASRGQRLRHRDDVSHRRRPKTVFYQKQ
jgi:hypothetical protein